MLSYELCKKLKKVGFAQILGGYAYNNKKLILPGESFRSKDYIFCPTLEELIEACGDEFYGIYFENKKWTACAIKHKKNSNQLNYERYRFSDSDSPSEAVANLWLELNKFL